MGEFEQYFTKIHIYLDNSKYKTQNSSFFESSRYDFNIILSFFVFGRRQPYFIVVEFDHFKKQAGLPNLS